MASSTWGILLLSACATSAVAFNAPGCPEVLEDVSLMQARPRREFPLGASATALVDDFSSSGQLSHKLLEIATRLPEGPTKELLTRLRVCTTCKMERFGEKHDGGYLMCIDEGGGVRAAYSMGVESHDKFSSDVYDRLKIPVHQFDCTVDGPASNCADCHFHRVCLAGASGGGSYPGGPNMNMQQVLESTSQKSVSNDSLIMKMDIEGAEWHIFSEGNSGLDKFKQMILEFHGLHLESNHTRYASALRNIQSAGFKVAHIHGNNYEGVYEVGGYAVPRVVEVTFVKSNRSLASCETDQRIHPLDRDNRAEGEALPMARLPS